MWSPYVRRPYLALPSQGCGNRLQRSLEYNKRYFAAAAGFICMMNGTVRPETSGRTEKTGIDTDYKDWDMISPAR